jgi:hypothetical protein
VAAGGGLCYVALPGAEVVVILFAHSDKSQITDFIMWADVEFAMQLQIMETRDFANQAATIIDLSELASIGGLGANEPLFVICHGAPFDMKVTEPTSYLDGESYKFFDLGNMIGSHLPATVCRIELWACYGADGPIGRRGLDRFAAGVRGHKGGVPIRGYVGATVTNTAATVTAQQGSSSTSADAVLVVNETKMDTAGFTDTAMRIRFAPQKSFDSYLGGTPNATPRQKAIRAAEQAEGFYTAFSNTLTSNKVYFGIGDNRSRPVTVTS